MKIRILVVFLFASGLAACSGGTSDDSAGNSGSDTGEASMQAGNPLLAEWDTPFGVPPFDLISSDDYLPALRAGMQEQVQEIAAIVANTSPADLHCSWRRNDHRQ